MAIGGLGLAAREVMKIKTSTGGFKVLGMQGSEHLGQMFEFSVDLVGELDLLNKPKDVKLHALIGTRATVTMDVEDDPRYFNGYITRMKRGERRGRYESFVAVLQPWTWFMTRTKNSRVFQTKSVKEVVTEVLADYGTDSEWRLISASLYPKLDYCIQHDETDFNFVSRLLEEAGIYYFFEHTETKHTMVLIDSMAKHKSRPGKKDINWSNAMKSASSVVDWASFEEVRSVKAVVSDHDYLAPATKIEAEKAALLPPAKIGTGEWFEHPSHLVQNGAKPEVVPSATAATQHATVRMEELQSLQATSTGTTNARDVSVGVTFSLASHPVSTENVNYLVVGARYRMEFADHEGIADLRSNKRRDGFLCNFVAISMSAPTFRSERVTPRPVIHGPQTAIVVGASGNEIETDKHGRVKVQFFWDRLGTKNENSSCWVRVAQPWAGKGYGMIALPRVGHEVVVSFLDGNPDRPLITGSVYNGENVPVYELPKLATVSGIKSRSSKEGTAETANELRFDDAKDKEYVWLQGQKDFYRLVKNDAFDFIGNNETTKVKLTRKEVIGENWFFDVGKDVMQNLGKDLHVNVAADIFYTGGATYQLKIATDMSVKAGGDLGIDVGGKTQLKSQADIALESSTGKLSLKAGAADLIAHGMAVKIKGDTTIALEAGATLTLKAGPSSVSLGPSGVDIVGPMVNINSGGSAGSAGSGLSASPTAPTDAKKEETTTPAKATDYDKLFEDPIKKSSSAS